MDSISKKIQLGPPQGPQFAHHNRHHGRNPYLPEDAADSEDLHECVLARGGYRVRLADTPGQRSKASLLIKSMYSWRGYTTDGIAPQPHDPNRITLEASSEKELFGTITVGLDSADGLYADELYEPEINTLRRMGRTVCEMTKLAFNPQFSSKEVIASLFHLAYLYAHKIHRANDLLIEINPRHASFYQNRLGFQQLGEERTCRRVDAPAVLLHVELDYMAAQITNYAGLRDRREKSLYPYFFPDVEAQGLTNRIRRTI